MKDVMNFINVFTSSNNNKEIIDVFSKCKCSYWFATILFRRFILNQATIVYDVQKRHFGTRIGNHVYDITGIVTDKYTWEVWVSVNKDIKDAITNELIMF